MRSSHTKQQIEQNWILLCGMNDRTWCLKGLRVCERSSDLMSLLSLAFGNWSIEWVNEGKSSWLEEEAERETSLRSVLLDLWIFLRSCICGWMKVLLLTRKRRKFRKREDTERERERERTRRGRMNLWKRLVIALRVNCFPLLPFPYKQIQWKDILLTTLSFLSSTCVVLSLISNTTQSMKDYWVVVSCVTEKRKDRERERETERERERVEPMNQVSSNKCD